MSPAALVVALLAPHAWPLRRRSPLLSLYGRLALSAAKRLDAGDRNSGMLAWFVLMAVVLVPVAIVTAIAVTIATGTSTTAISTNHASMPELRSPASRRLAAESASRP